MCHATLVVVEPATTLTVVLLTVNDESVKMQPELSCITRQPKVLCPLFVQLCEDESIRNDEPEDIVKLASEYMYRVSEFAVGCNESTTFLKISDELLQEPEREYVLDVVDEVLRDVVTNSNLTVEDEKLPAVATVVSAVVATVTLLVVTPPEIVSAPMVDPLMRTTDAVSGPIVIVVTAPQFATTTSKFVPVMVMDAAQLIVVEALACCPTTTSST